MPYSDEELAEIWVGGAPPVLTGPVVLADYDPAWPNLYEREAGRLRQILGARVQRLLHVGSTSVPGLAAKPVIDIVLVVADSSDEPAWLPGLEEAGYRLVIREPAWFEHRALKGPDTDINLHVYSAGTSEVQRCEVFRDRLRSHPDERELYARTKRELAARPWTYVQQYADAKTEVITAILGRAGWSDPAAGE